MYGSIVDTIKSMIGSLGITTATATAVTRAMASPTLDSISAAQAAFQAEGTTMPPELLNLLYQRYYDSLASNPFAQSGSIAQFSQYLPYIVIGGLALWLIMKK